MAVSPAGKLIALKFLVLILEWFNIPFTVACCYYFSLYLKGLGVLTGWAWVYAIMAISIVTLVEVILAKRLADWLRDRINALAEESQ